MKEESLEESGHGNKPSVAVATYQTINLKAERLILAHGFSGFSVRSCDIMLLSQDEARTLCGFLEGMVGKSCSPHSKGKCEWREGQKQRRKGLEQSIVLKSILPVTHFLLLVPIYQNFCHFHIVH